MTADFTWPNGLDLDIEFGYLTQRWCRRDDTIRGSC